MSKGLIDGLEWYGSIAGAIAALIVALDLGRRPTGWAFVIFVTSSVALVTWGFVSEKAEGIGTQNVILFAINVIGVYRYLIRKKPVHA
ncbi:MAG: hypothetical protein QOJ94_411 [Sphingomonadales bacterium]|jgi:hypothetical protein|nr:hypothetical protein [Sphingomonadales bacterium]